MGQAGHLIVDGRNEFLSNDNKRDFRAPTYGWWLGWLYTKLYVWLSLCPIKTFSEDYFP